MPVCVAFFIFLKDLGVQSMMCTQLEPNIAREVSDVLTSAEVRIPYIKKATRSITEVIRLI